jgi:DNA-binding NtrC family response regulator
VLDIHLPPLREQLHALPGLAELFIRRFTPPGREPPSLSPRALTALVDYPFPGNLRELEHAMHHAVTLAPRGVVDVEHLPIEIGGGAASQAPEFLDDEPPQILPLAQAIGQFEKEYLVRALREAGGVKVRAARLLGISRKTLWEKLRDHGLADRAATGEDDVTKS